MHRILWRIVIPFGAFIGGGWLAFQWWLGSAQATHKVAAILSETLGAPVTVGSLELHTDNCAALDVCIFEPGSKPGDAPLLRIERAEADLGLPDILGGATQPKIITLHGWHAVLRYTRDWDFETKLPKARPSARPPTLYFLDGKLTFRRPGVTDCTIAGIKGSTKTQDGQLHFGGGVNDPAWGGRWQAEAAAPLAGGAATLHLQAAGVHVAPETLARVPFVDDEVWHHVRLDGDTPVDVKVTIPTDAKPVRYRVELAPTNTTVHVSSIGLDATAARGVVVVEDKFVALRNVVGRVAEGELRLKLADLDFRSKTTAMKFDLEALKLNLKRLPEGWKLPPRLGGKLSGTANLVVNVVNGTAVPSGAGDGRVDDAAIGFIPFPNYGLKIQADRNGFRFEPRFGGK